MTINDIEKLTGLTKKSIRYYEQEGLVSPKREENDYRNYSEDDLAILKRIKIYRYLGFTVPEIKAMLEQQCDEKEALQKKADQWEATNEDAKDKQELCIKLLRQDLNDTQIMDEYVEKIDVLDSEELKEAKKTLMEMAVPNIYAAIAETLIFMGPPLGLAIRIADRKWNGSAVFEIRVAF